MKNKFFKKTILFSLLLWSKAIITCCSSETSNEIKAAKILATAIENKLQEIKFYLGKSELVKSDTLKQSFIHEFESVVIHLPMFSKIFDSEDDESAKYIISEYLKINTKSNDVSSHVKHLQKIIIKRRSLLPERSRKDIEHVYSAI